MIVNQINKGDFCMENLDHAIFEAEAKEDKFSFWKIKREWKRRIRKIQNKVDTKMIKNHFMTLVIGAALAFIVIDVILIINFMSLLRVL